LTAAIGVVIGARCPHTNEESRAKSTRAGEMTLELSWRRSWRPSTIDRATA